MKSMRKIASLLLALAMIFALATTAFAQTISITPPANIDPNAENTYKIYKVFDATINGKNIAYTLVNGKTTAPAGFEVENGYVSYNGAGTDELTAADIAAIAAYVADDTPIATATSKGAAKATASNLPAGYYYITTSTGSVVTIDSAEDDSTVEVNDKNTIPGLDKKITGATSFDNDGKKALAQIGTEVEYTVTITVGKGATGYIFHDTMDSGLTFKGNDSVDVSGTNGTYTVQTTPATGDTLTIVFNNDIAAGETITIKYKAIVNENALTVDPVKNTAYVSYGHESKYETKPVETEVYKAKFTVTKTDGNDQPLKGAGFVIKNAEGKYYKIVDNVVSWVNSIDDATENFSGDDGVVPSFIGLANGKYTLVEKTVPAGYNKTENDHEFEIIAHNYSADNLEQEATVVNRAGTELPSTGGMGTTLFYIVGGVLVAAAVVLLVTKKRMASAN